MSVDFFRSFADEPHPARSRALLKAHPELRLLVGRNPYTALVAGALVIAQTALAFLIGSLGSSYWWIALPVAYGFGAFANHASYVIIHDATHNLIFANRSANKLVAILADLPNLFPGAMGFRVYHLKHHAHQGDYDLDADLPSRWEARLIGNRWYGKALWLLFFPVFQVIRPPRLKSIVLWDRWVMLNSVCAIAYDLAIVYFCGWPGFLYLALSFFFSVGLHPLGARWIQEHYTTDPVQETFSYYGPANVLALNVGYHNEHHDLPSVPWNRLPRMREIAPEFYDNLKSHRSWTRLLLEFIFDERYSLFSRVERIEPIRQREHPVDAAPEIGSAARAAGPQPV
jgi:sphingolipid delta-4 desaturase